MVVKVFFLVIISIFDLYLLVLKRKIHFGKNIIRGLRIKKEKMKNNISKLTLIVFIGFLTSCTYRRLGDFTMISNRNVDSSIKYELLTRDAEVKVKAKKGDPLERAIDKLTSEHEGEYLMNVKIYMRKSGKKFKVIGDVYGMKKVLNEVTSKVKVDIEFKYGDKVTFEKGGKLIYGTISGINKEGAIVEYLSRGKTKRKQVSFDFITKLK